MYKGMKPFVLSKRQHAGLNGRRPEDAAPSEAPQATGPLQDFAEQLAVFHARYNTSFVTRTRSVVEYSKKYLLGLIQSEKRNMERMAEVVPEANDQAYGHFISQSPWDHRSVLDQIGSDVDAALGDSPDRFLVVDESAIAKKGKKSVGVARQWNGRLGKVDNCQVGVFLALGCGDEVTLINERLYLPREWSDHPERCDEAGIPEEERVFRTKSQLAQEMVRHAHRQGLRYEWTSLDGGYGKEGWLLRALDRDGEIWVADVHCDQTFYLEDPEPIVPERRRSRGRAPSRLAAQTKAVRVDKWAAAQPEADWKQVMLRESTKGTLSVEVLHRRVSLWDGDEPSAHCWHLIVRREIGSPREIKYSLSNAPEATTTERLAFMQAQRYWVEHALRNAKSEVGMADYQLRLWQGWHHHMTMVMLALLFMFEVRRKHKENLSLLSCHDVVELLRVLLPRANVTFEEILAQLEERHRRRQASIDSAYAKQMRTRQYSGP
jgi:SRSO17 transposase